MSCYKYIEWVHAPSLTNTNIKMEKKCIGDCYLLLQNNSLHLYPQTNTDYERQIV